jgi:hypothetical protein
VLLGVPGEVIGASKDSDEDVLGRHLMGGVRLYSRHRVARSLTWVYKTDEAINAGRTIPYAIFLSRGPADPSAGDATY